MQKERIVLAFGLIAALTACGTTTASLPGAVTSASLGAQSVLPITGPKGNAAAVVQPHTPKGPTRTTPWVDVPFTYSGPLPRAFELWRSFDGVNFTQVVSIAPKSTGQSNAQFIIRDRSRELTDPANDGVEAFFKIRSVSSAVTESDVVSTTLTSF